MTTNPSGVGCAGPLCWTPTAPSHPQLHALVPRIRCRSETLPRGPSRPMHCSPVEAPSARAFAMCPTVWIPPSAITGTPNLLAYSDTLYTAVAWGRPHASTAAGERAQARSAPRRQRVPSPAGPLGFQHTHAPAPRNAQIPGCSFPRPSCKRSRCPGDACWDTLTGLDSKRLQVTSGPGSLPGASRGSRLVLLHSGRVGTSRRKRSRLQKPLSRAPLAHSHDSLLTPSEQCQTPSQHARQLWDVLLGRQLAGRAPGCVYICTDTCIYTHTHPHTQTDMQQWKRKQAG